MAGKTVGAVGLGVLAAGVAGNAEAQPAFSFSLTIDHSDFAEGRGQLVDVPVGNLGGFPDGPASVWSVFLPGGITADESRSWIIAADESLDPAVHAGTFASFGATVTPAQSAYHFADTLTFQTRSDVVSWLNDAAAGVTDVGFDEFDLQENCFPFNGLANGNNIGLSDDLIVHYCDAVDANIAMHEFGLRITGTENDPNLTFQVAPVGYSFTSSGAFDRDEAWVQFGDAFRASTAADDMAAALLGLPSVSGIALGTLPTGGDFFTASFSVNRSAAPAGGGLPAQDAFSFQTEFGFDSIREILAYGLINREASEEDFGLPTAFGVQDQCFDDGEGGVSGRCDAIDVSVGLLGVELHVTSEENNPDIAFAIDAAGLSFASDGAIDREDAETQFIEFIDTEENSEAIVSALLAGLAASRPDDPLVGNPTSLQGSFNQALLNLDQPSALLDETSEPTESEQSGAVGRRDVDPPGWFIGGRAGTFTIGTEEATFVEAALERGWRLGEGRRSRMKLSAPFTYTDYGEDNQQSTAALRLSAEVPLREGKWVLEPSAGVGYFFETDEFGSGALYSVGISSRYKIAPVGRGHIIIGNAISYSSTIEIDGGGPIKTPEIQNTAFRNGLAYQVPIGDRMFGRQTTVRASYAYTALDGDEVFLDAYHDVTLSFGFGAREASVRQVYEAMRIGFSGTVGEDFEAYSLNLGFRF